jgi:DNA-binding TFAR19-related protein (PDSD5 family)
MLSHHCNCVLSSWKLLLLWQDDPELEAIRQRRMQELMGHGGGGGGAPQSREQQQAQEEQKREAEENRQLMLARVLSSEARERRKVFLTCSR